jgi:ComF family protein
MAANWREAVGRMVALALPPRCASCGAVTREDHRFCADCWQALDWLGDPSCAGCALPFESDRGAGALCGGCIADPPPHSGVRAAVAYGEVARRTVLKLKYGGRIGHAVTLARLMARSMPGDATLIVPVPLHRRRLWSRGYNQASLMARALADATGVPASDAVLVRRRATPVLKGLGRRQRAKALQSAFVLTPDASSRVAGGHVVLVDDVHTSGATADACARTLLSGGAAKLTVLCWARVIDGRDD